MNDGQLCDKIMLLMITSDGNPTTREISKLLKIDEGIVIDHLNYIVDKKPDFLYKEQGSASTRFLLNRKLSVSIKQFSDDKGFENMVINEQGKEHIENFKLDNESTLSGWNVAIRKPSFIITILAIIGTIVLVWYKITYGK